MALTKLNAEIDIRHILPAIRVPALVLHRTGDPLCPVEGGRYIAANIPGASLVEVPGSDHLPFVGDVDALLGPVQEFLTGDPPAMQLDRVLTTILVIDIVDSTRRAIALGDIRWHDLLESYRMIVRHELGRFRGDERNATGDDFVATFDGPVRPWESRLGQGSTPGSAHCPLWSSMESRFISPRGLLGLRLNPRLP